MKGSWLIAAIAAGLLAAPAAAPPQLKYVVILSRHGVRSPTWELSRLNEYSAQPWPDWGVAPGELTPHGRDAIKRLGAYYHDWLSAENLFAPQDCSGAAGIYIWADKEQRTLETGRALSETLLPGCKVETHSQPGGDADPIFSGAGTADPALALKAVQDRLGADPQRLLADHHDALIQLRSLLSGGAALPNDFVANNRQVGAALNGKTVALNGPFDTSSTLSEDLLLEYADGMQGSTLGWGRLNQDNLFRVLELHAFYADLMRRTPYLARTRGSNLVAHVLHSMQQAALGQSVTGSIGKPGDSALILAGHDTNQSNVSGMLDLQWTLPGYQPNETPPGGALIFTLWKDPAAGTLFVKAQYVAQSLDQMRNATLLTLAAPPESVEVPIPGCKSAQQTAGCPWPAFQRVLEAAIDPNFIGLD